MTDTERLFHRMSLYVRRALNIPCPPGWAFPYRYSYDYEILYVQSGTLYMQVDGVEYSGHPGDLFFLPPGVAHFHRNAGEDTLLIPHIHFDWYFSEDSEAVPILTGVPQDTGMLRENLGLREPLLALPIKATMKDPAGTLTRILEIIDVKSGGHPIEILKLKALMAEFLYRLIIEHRERGEGGARIAPDWMVERANRYMREHYDREVRMEELARLVGYSTNHFAAKYRAECGLSPLEYHRRLRGEYARNRLLCTDMSISQIAEELGFGSIYSFSRFFKEREGVSPSRFRTRGLAE